MCSDRVEPATLAGLRTSGGACPHNHMYTRTLLHRKLPLST